MTRVARMRQVLDLPPARTGLEAFFYARMTSSIASAHVRDDCRVLRLPMSVEDVMASEVALSGCMACGSSRQYRVVSECLEHVRHFFVASDSAVRYAASDDHSDYPAYAGMHLRAHLDPTWAFAGDLFADDTTARLRRALESPHVPRSIDVDAWASAWREAMLEVSEALVVAQPMLAPVQTRTPSLYLVSGSLARNAAAELYRYRPVAGWRTSDGGAALFRMSATTAKAARGTARHANPWVVSVAADTVARLDGENGWEGVIDMMHAGQEISAAAAQRRWDAAVAAASV